MRVGIGRLRYYREFHIRGPSNSDSDSKLREYVAKAPIVHQPSWRRLAETVKEDKMSNRLKEEIKRASISQADHVAKIEEEIQEEMAKALGITGSKCKYFFKVLEDANSRCEELENQDASFDERLRAVQEYNQLREMAENARTELVIHRQAIGFSWRNQKLVEEEFPLRSKRSRPTE